MLNMHCHPNIFLIEDSDEDYDTYMYCFDKLGLKGNIERYTTGQDSLDAILAKPLCELTHTIVFLDLNLPSMHGREILNTLRQNELTHQVPVIIITTSKLPSDVSEAYHLGANTYIQKPLELSKFSNMIELVLNYWFNVATLPNHVNERSSSKEAK